MGYLQELRQELEQIIDNQLDEETKKAVLQLVSARVYDSWKNGIERGKAQQSEPNGSQQSSPVGN